MARFSMLTALRGQPAARLVLAVAVSWLAVACTRPQGGADEAERAGGKGISDDSTARAQGQILQQHGSAPTVPRLAAEPSSRQAEGAVLASAVTAGNSLRCKASSDCSAGEFCRWPQGARRLAPGAKAAAAQATKLVVGSCQAYLIEADLCDPELVEAEPPQQRCSPELVCGAAGAGFACRRPCDVDGDCYDTEHCDAEFLCRRGPRCPEGERCPVSETRHPLVSARQQFYASSSRP